VELFLSCLTSVGPGHGANNLWGCGYSCLVWAGSQSLFRYSHAQINEGVAEEVVLPEERRFYAAPYIH
jgi:hypothetical protein